MARIDGRNRLLAHGDRPRRRDDLVEILAATVLHRLPGTKVDVAIEIAELQLQAFGWNSLRIVWKPRPPPSVPVYAGRPIHRAKGTRSSNIPLPRMGESIREAEERLKREAEKKSE